MQYLSHLFGMTLRSGKDDIGTLEDAYIDSYEWKVRYIVVETGDWSDRRVVAISPHIIQGIEPENDILASGISRDRIAESPSIDAKTPLTRQEEIELHNYYQWPFYWDVVSDEALGVGNLAAVPLVEMAEDLSEEAAAAEETVVPTQDGDEESTVLFSAREVEGYAIHARDGNIGVLEDFIVQEETWDILYLIVDAGRLLEEKRVILAPQWVTRWEEDAGEIHMDLKRDTVKHSPQLKSDAVPDRNFETKLYSHYRKNVYWEQKK